MRQVDTDGILHTDEWRRDGGEEVRGEKINEPEWSSIETRSEEVTTDQEMSSLNLDMRPPL